MSAITIRLDWPYKELWPNFRTREQYIVREARRIYRKTCFADARIAKDGRTEYPLMGPVEAHAVFYITKGRGPDVDNCVAAAKAAVDGVADAGVIANDKDIVSWTAEVKKGNRRELVLMLREQAL